MGPGDDLTPIATRACAVFALEAAGIPPMSLRAGNAIDSYETAPAWSDTADRLSDDYLEQHYWGIAHLDPLSFRHYLPALIDYGLRHIHAGNNVVDAFLFALRPPDRDPPRLGSLSSEQEAAVVAFLHAMAFNAASVCADDAMLALEEWWGPGARHRTAASPSGDT